MPTLRYLGPLEAVTDGVLPGTVARGETIDVADELVTGRPHTFADGYQPEMRDGETFVNGDMIVEYGISGLLDQTYQDVDGNVRPCWELVEPAKAKASKVDPPE